MNEPKQSLLSYELDLYKQFIKDEEDRRNRCSDKVFKSIAMVISLAGAVLWLAFEFHNKYDPKNQTNLQTANFVFLILSIIIMIIAICVFFHVLYGYSDKGLDPQKIRKTIQNYKEEGDKEDEIIKVMNESLLISYRVSAINIYNENRKRGSLFSLFYALILIEIFLLIITLILEKFI